MTFDGKFGYARSQGGGNGFVLGPAMYYSVYNDTGFVKNLGVGLGLDYAMVKNTGVWGYNLFLSPEARLEMPYSYFKLGFGYDYFRVAGINNNLFGMKIGVGALFTVAEGVKMGLDFTFDYAFNQGNLTDKLWMINVGPMVSFDL
jgi:hypothetical protein